MQFFEVVDQVVIDERLSVDEFDEVLLQVDAFHFQVLERVLRDVVNEIEREIEFIVDVRTSEFRDHFHRVGLTLNVVRPVDFDAAVAARAAVDGLQWTRANCAARQQENEKREFEHDLEDKCSTDGMTSRRRRRRRLVL